jgi:hypothetical protein
MVIAIAMVKVVSGAHRDQRSCSESEFQTIQYREVKQPFWREEGLRPSGYH